MSPRHSTPSFAQTAVSPGGGCLSGFLVPPLAVLLVGGLMILLLQGSSPTSIVPGASGEPVPGGLQQDKPGAAAGPLASLFTPEVQYWSDSIRAWAAEAGLDPNLVATVMQIESCGNPSARSGAGAMGLFQVMPYHFFGTDAPYDPATNAARGLAYLSRALAAAAGDPRLALAGYNGGISVIGRSERNWAAETQRYAYWGSGIYADAARGADGSERLQEWLAAGGASLCRKASQKLGLAP